MQRNKFVFYRSFYESMEWLSDKQRLEVYDSIMNYALNWQEYSWEEQIAKIIFTMAKPQIDANNKKFKDWSNWGRPTHIISQNQEDEKPLVTPLGKPLHKPVGKPNIIYISSKEDIKEILDNDFMKNKINQLKIFWEMIDCWMKVEKEIWSVEEIIKWIEELCVDVIWKSPEWNMLWWDCISYAKKRKEYWREEYKQSKYNKKWRNYKSSMRNAFTMYNKK